MINISSWTDLKNIINDLTEDYQLTRDLLSTDDDYIGIGDSWISIGTEDDFPTSCFTGSFNGNGYKIHNLIVDGDIRAGLFGYIYNATISNVGLLNVDIYGSYEVGALVGYNRGTISNSYVSGGTITGATGGIRIGGLVGSNDSESTISKCYTKNVTINGTNLDYVGGLSAENNGIINNCYADSTVTGVDVGGLVGMNFGTINNCYSIGQSTGYDVNGGLVGYNWGSGYIYNSFSTGVVTGNIGLGRLVGFNDGGQVVNCGYWNNGGIPAIGNDNSDPLQVVPYSETDKTWFYNKTRGIYTGVQLPYWDFTTPIWYEHVSDYPNFTPETSPTSLKTKIRGAQIKLEDSALDVATDSVVFWVPNN